MYLGKGKTVFIFRTATVWTLEGKEMIKCAYCKHLWKSMGCWLIPTQCSKSLYLCFNLHSLSLCHVLAELETLWNQLFWWFMMCCFLISAIAVPWAGMIWTDSGWSPVPSFIQLFTTPKVFCTICAALAGLLWWVFSSVFYKLLCVDWLLQLYEQLCFRAREILKVSYAVTLSSYRSVLNVLDFLLNLLTNNSKFQSPCTPVIWIWIL